MTHIFFDESSHEKGNFTLGAFVLCEDNPEHAVNASIKDVGFTPGVHEYKSGARHSSDPRLQELRRKLYHVAMGCRVGLMIAPYKDRHQLGNHVLNALRMEGNT